MNTENLKYLENEIYYKGFGKELYGELIEKLALQVTKFQLHFRKDYLNDTVTAVLDFSKSATSDMYFFNDFKLQLISEHNKKLMSQSFKVGGVNAVTFKEAYNLMNGRAIFKEWTKLKSVIENDKIRYVPTEDKYKAWKKLNFDETYSNGNFKFIQISEGKNFNSEDLINEISFPTFKNEADYQRLLKSFHKGNIQSVNLGTGDKDTNYLILDPEQKKIIVLDLNMKPIQLENSRDIKLEQNIEKALALPKEKVARTRKSKKKVV